MPLRGLGRQWAMIIADLFDFAVYDLNHLRADRLDYSSA
jgi:hypothetical protein